ncbi:oxygen-independent coproporphyrinogen III oxidase [Rhodoferax koreense]|uniref:Coproporphyrinogen-III oxidase n=1 Tax=Rhodoferax koreensis TaxID=1842727 RepID=A0A1P8K3H9_9BURK|nr:oxygen-independent coproporphyrinogen III oxidase [Rhodoferax koreense]APW40562.1 oxygen-independent coproporphyrinogen III oxidase [Rhodoferax koreense]
MAVPTEDLLRRLDVPGPRYTSYPTADRFSDGDGAEPFLRALEQRRGRAGPSLPLPLSLYVHIPFCESLCHYCACNKIITRRHELARPYLDDLRKEAGLYVERIGRGQVVSQLHLGGGSPTFFSDEELAELIAMLREHFTLPAEGEYAIEVDPRTVDAARLRRLADIGFNRLSLGVQDFDPAVQRAVHRVQPLAQVTGLMQAARAIGFDSINVDLIYGLPLQTPDSFARTLAQVTALRPDRVALYGYAHLPERFKAQRRIADHALPGGPARVRMLAAAMAAFEQAGYVYIGMDHFALPEDALARAKRQGRLHRNFQGYSTQPDSDLIALGVSAIGRVGASYGQNAKTLEAYRQALAENRLPIERGLGLTRDDLVRRAVIMALMCQGCVDFESVELGHLIDFRSYFAAELQVLAGFAAEGLVDIDLGAGVVQVTPTGWFVVRAIAMVFDHYLRTPRSGSQFSRIA